jgi:hypothetical protein
MSIPMKKVDLKEVDRKIDHHISKIEAGRESRSNSFYEFLDNYFNWRKHPGSVFYVALPLFFFAVSLHAAYAYLMYKMHGDITFAVILGVLMMICAGAIYRAWSNHLRLMKLLDGSK